MKPLVHPVFVAYTGGLFLLGAAIGAHGVLPAHVLAPVLWGIWFAFGASALGILINDYFDREIDRHNPRKAAFDAVYNERYWKRYGIFVAAAFGSAAVLLWWSWSFLMAVYLAVFVLGTLAYNVPPIRLKERPGPDILVGPTSFVPPLVAGYTLVSGAAPTAPLVLAAVLFFSALELFHKTFDIEADTAAGVRTAATRLGLKRSLLICAALECAAAALVFGSFRTVLPVLVLAPYLAMVTVAYTKPLVGERRAFYGRMRLWHVLIGTAVTIYFFFI